MAAPSCVTRTACATPDLVQGLSDSEDELPEEDEEDEEQESPNDSAGPDCAEGLSSGSSLVTMAMETSSTEARTPPRTPKTPRVAKRTRRVELLERWPAWSSPARKRQRSASPEAAVDRAPVRCFWRLVEKVANSTPSLAGRQDDCQRLCGLYDVEADWTALAASGCRPCPSIASPTPGSTPSPRLSPRPSSCPSPTLAVEVQLLPPPAWGFQEVLKVPAASVDTLSSSLASLADHILPPPTPFSGSPAKVRGDASPGALATDSTATASKLSDDLREVRVDNNRPDTRGDFLERLLATGPLVAPDSGFGEDSSVLQLLVLTPTEDRKLHSTLRPEGPRGRALLARWSLADSVASAKLTQNAVDCLLGVKVPYFILILGLIQVTLYASPTPYGAQELKNMFVWDSKELFRQPWRTLTYAMLHSGQMHMTLNVGVQTIVGAPLEREQGAVRVALVYCLGAAFGALVTGVVSPSLLMVGASAGIYSLLMSHLAQVWLNSGSVRYGKLRAGAVLVLTCADMVYTAHHAMGNAAPRIGVTAHWAGALSGLLLGLALYAPYAPPRALVRAAALASSLLLATAALFCPLWIYFAGRAE